MDDERTAVGVEHLQRAAKELVAAARSFLDVVEDVIEDPDRFGETAASMVDLVREGLGSLGASRTDAPWAANAWTTPQTAEDREPDATQHGSTDAAVPAGTSAETVPGRSAPTPERAPRRVRRIAVD